MFMASQTLAHAPTGRTSFTKYEFIAKFVHLYAETRRYRINSQQIDTTTKNQSNLYEKLILKIEFPFEYLKLRKFI